MPAFAQFLLNLRNALSKDSFSLTMTFDIPFPDHPSVDLGDFCDIISVVRLGKTLYVLPSTITQQKGGQEKVCQMSSLKKTSL